MPPAQNEALGFSSLMLFRGIRSRENVQIFKQSVKTNEVGRKEHCVLFKNQRRYVSITLKEQARR